MSNSEIYKKLLELFEGKSYYEMKEFLLQFLDTSTMRSIVSTNTQPQK